MPVMAHLGGLVWAVLTGSTCGICAGKLVALAVRYVVWQRDAGDPYSHRFPANDASFAPLVRRAYVRSSSAWTIEPAEQRRGHRNRAVVSDPARGRRPCGLWCPDVTHGCARRPTGRAVLAPTFSNLVCPFPNWDGVHVGAHFVPRSQAVLAPAASDLACPSPFWDGMRMRASLNTSRIGPSPHTTFYWSASKR